MPFRLIVSSIFAAASLLLLAGAVAAHEYEGKAVTIAHPWARATPGGATVGAAFFQLKAPVGAGDRLLSVASPLAGRAEIHTHIEEQGVMKMRRLDSLDVLAGKSVILRPAGDHIMLFDLKAPLKEGDLLPLTLTFEKSGDIKIEANIEPVGAKGPHGLEHQPDDDAAGSDEGSHSGSHSGTEHESMGGQDHGSH